MAFQEKTSPLQIGNSIYRINFASNQNHKNYTKRTNQKK